MCSRVESRFGISVHACWKRSRLYELKRGSHKFERADRREIQFVTEWNWNWITHLSCHELILTSESYLVRVALSNYYQYENIDHDPSGTKYLHAKLYLKTSHSRLFNVFIRSFQLCSRNYVELNHKPWIVSASNASCARGTTHACQLRLGLRPDTTFPVSIKYLAHKACKSVF